ncbi:MAG: restriction endonuclease subunit S, partial [Desulfobacteraceae bacterium]|nr:restriction endonuclease subunit S [Desulfobacteraceae bacterium]
MKLAPYPEYKDSGVPWLGKIPVHWDETKLKRVSHVQTGVTLGKRYEKAVLVERPYLRVANVQNGFLNLKHIKTVAVPAKEAESSELRNGDVVITEGGDIDKLGRGAIWTGEIEHCLHQNHIFAIRPVLASLIPGFLSRMMESHHGRSYFYLTSKRTTNLASTNQTTLGLLPLFLPSIEEQTQIARFLDWKAAQINKFIRNKRRLIELLKEQKQNVINQAVTGKCEVRRVKGEDGKERLEAFPTSPLKLRPSGVEWIGDIPEHWEARRLRTLAAVRASGVDKNTNEDEVPVMLCNNVNIYKNEHITPKIDFMKATASKHEIRNFELKTGDLIITKDSLNPEVIGVPSYVPESLPGVLCAYHLYLIRPFASAIESKFLLRAFSSSAVSRQFRVATNGVTIVGLPQGAVKATVIPLPPLKEQRAIIAHINEKCAEISQAISRAEREIELMREYRTRLISDVVTGQVDVRRIEVPEVADEELLALEE